MENLTRRGLMYVLSSPSGAGKTTISRALLKSNPDIKVSVSATTRPRRAGEVHGQDYFFVSTEKFREMVDVTGVIVTKLDSTAKGGMIFAINHDLGLPIHYTGLGEKISDLVPFRPDFFVDSLFEDEEQK